MKPLKRNDVRRINRRIGRLNQHLLKPLEFLNEYNRFRLLDALTMLLVAGEGHSETVSALIEELS